MTVALGLVLVAYALSSRVYGDAHARVMSAAPSIPTPARVLISLRERYLVPGGLVSASGALLALAQGCQVALVALVVTAAVAAILDGGIAVALVGASRSTAPAVAETHRQAEVGARVEGTKAKGRQLLLRNDEARNSIASRRMRA